MPLHKNDPITLELPAHVVDLLADWARLDARIMRPSQEPGDKLRLHEQCTAIAHGVVLGVLKALPNFSVDGDFADALNERDEAYADYAAAKAAKDH